MSIDIKFLELFIKATEKAAIGAVFIGKKDKIAADKGAGSNEKAMNNMDGTIVIGEGNG